MSKSAKHAAPDQPESPRQILVIDDEPVIREVLESYLTAHGFVVTPAETGAEGLELANKLPIQLIILDVLLTDADGLELLELFKKTRPSRPVIIVTGFGMDEELLREAKERGASEYLSKTAPLEELLQKIEAALIPRKARTRRGAIEFSEPPEPIVRPKLEEEDTVQLAEAPPAVSSTAGFGWIIPRTSIDFGIEVFLRMLTAFNANLGNTALRATKLCQTLGEVAELSTSQVRDLTWAAALHDISLVSLDHELVRRWLRFPKKCSAPEMALIRQHPERSQRMLEFCPVFERAGEIIRSHHEHWDGSGYPDGLKGEATPWLARVLAATVFYCNKDIPGAHALSETRHQAEAMFDPRAVDVVAKAVRRVKLPRGEREVPFHDLQPGMALSADINGKDGMLILAKGTVLTQECIHRISHLQDTTPLDPLVRVKC